MLPYKQTSKKIVEQNLSPDLQIVENDMSSVGVVERHGTYLGIFTVLTFQEKTKSPTVTKYCFLFPQYQINKVLPAQQLFLNGPS